METAYRIAVLILLATLVGAVIYEGEKIAASQYHFSGMDVQQVQVVNAKRDPIPVETVVPVTVEGEVTVNGGKVPGKPVTFPVRVSLDRY
jgi:hypothetical protein